MTTKPQNGSTRRPKSSAFTRAVAKVLGPLSKAEHEAAELARIVESTPRWTPEHVLKVAK